MWKLVILLPVLVHSSAAVADEKIVKVFVLAGQSNMEGQGVVDLDHPQHYNGGKGTLIWSMEHGGTKAKMKHLKDASGKWKVREDVLVRYQTPHELKVGNLAIGFAVYPGKHHIGPELQIGHLVGDHFDENVFTDQDMLGREEPLQRLSATLGWWRNRRVLSENGERGPECLGAGWR